MIFNIAPLKFRCMDASDSSGYLKEGDTYIVKKIGSDGCFYFEDGSGWSMDRFEEVTDEH